ncbi:hypothetical protein OEB99_11660 [Actinotalea sp. M2MS4P-6]|uniref:hypothetical protein n=1 Tax=Actinotalea sp. M2MS4P-6 TaxID=2983762 RepID=UPI0021E387CB|nr:hypothetical protein [Actinotalea sp. M2MS4P-6]MCV2394964.1 hypothetical protein [Actinotalea sp. M2MS4P-6]
MSSIPPNGPGSTGDEAFDRLRAADPAAGSEPDLRALRAAVAARAEAGAAAGDQLATRRARWPIAAAAAAALVIGAGGGYAIGAVQGTASSGSDEALSVATAEDGAMGGAMESAAPEPGRVAGGGVASDSSMAAGDAAWWGYGRTVFTAQGLSDQAGTAQVRAVDAAAVFDADSMAAAATVLGVPGTPEQTDGVWAVGPQDGSAASLSMYPEGNAGLNFYDPTADPWSCTAEDAAKDTGCTERDLGPAPSATEAEAQLADLLGALGLDAAGFQIEADAGSDTQWTYVTAYEVIDGVRTGRTWSASYTGGGLQSLYGSLAPLVDLGEYPVVSPVEAVARLSDPRFGTSGPMWFDDTVGLSDSVSTLPAPDAVPTGVPDTPEPGSPVSWPVQHVTITGAELVSGMQTDGAGAVLLVPTYRLTGSDGSVWSVLAVADDALDFS